MADERDIRRVVQAFSASLATGLVIYLLVIHIALPRLADNLTAENREWLHDAFARHPIWVLMAIVGFSALSALPVLGVFRWVYGPLRRKSSGSILPL